MKTKFFVMTLIVLGSTSAFSQSEGQRIAVINQGEPGVFKVIYEAASVGKVRMSIIDKEQDVVYEDVNTTDGFIRKLNFNGMKPGEYTVQIADGMGKQSKTIVYGYKKSTIKDVQLVKVSEEGKYLLAVTNDSPESIHLNIFDGFNNLVHSSDLIINGKLKMIYNLKEVGGTPIFEVTDALGNVRALAMK